jgi:S-adenosylmethionine hydrolase
MKTIYFLFLLLTSTIFSFNIFSVELPQLSDKNSNFRNELILAHKFKDFYNQILADQAAIQKINLLRPRIYIYTDFGGGENANRPVNDLQTSGEISSAAWKGTLQESIYLNDSAIPLSPIDAAISLAKTFPYQEKCNDIFEGEEISIRTIIVHVVDPGVGNDLDKNNPQPRSMVLRKDGILFIGPDNGTLSFVCPTNSIAQCWEIDVDTLTLLSGINTKVGGTFHGRDVFCEAAFRIAAGIITPSEIGIKYKKSEIINRIDSHIKYEKLINDTKALKFEKIFNHRFFLNMLFSDEDEIFEKAFLLGTVQSSLYQDTEPLALTASKKIFLPKEIEINALKNLIAIVNYKNGNIFVGPNNGLGTSFIKNFSSDEVKVFSITKEIFQSIINENNTEIAASLIESQPIFKRQLKEIDFLGSSKDLITDKLNRPKKLKAKIWVDLYGNIKMTISNLILEKAKELNASIKVIINGTKKTVGFADTFSQVPRDQLFIYSGSTGYIGPNPHRSKRYVELASNGIFGKFGIDFFEKKGIKPKSGDIIWLEFKYLDKQNKS